MDILTTGGEDLPRRSTSTILTTVLTTHMTTELTTEVNQLSTTETTTEVNQLSTTETTTEVNTATTSDPGQNEVLIVSISILAAFITGIAITLICMCVYNKIKKSRNKTKNIRTSTVSINNLYAQSNGGTLPYSVVTLDTDIDAAVEEESKTGVVKKDDGYVEMKGNPTNHEYINTSFQQSQATAHPPLKKNESIASQKYESMDMPYYNVDKLNTPSENNNKTKSLKNKDDHEYIDVLPEDEDVGDNDSIYEPYDENKQDSTNKQSKRNNSRDKNVMKLQLFGKDSHNKTTEKLKSKTGPQVPKKPKMINKLNPELKDKPGNVKTENVKNKMQLDLTRELNETIGKRKANSKDEQEVSQVPLDVTRQPQSVTQEPLYVNVK